MDAPEGSDAVAKALKIYIGHYVLYLLDRRSGLGTCGVIRQRAAITMQTRSLRALS